MDNSKASVSLFLDTRRSKKKDKYPVKLSVYFDCEKKRFKTGVDITKEEWEKVNSPKLREDKYRIIKRKLNAKVENALSIIDQLPSFSFAAFEEMFYEERKIRRTSSLKDLFEQYIEHLEANDQIGTAVSYKCTLRSFSKFKSGLKVGDITKDTLVAYERYMLGEGLSPSTVGIYMRQLRCIVNRAIAQGLLRKEKYPFNGYTIPTTRNIKKALSEAQIKELLEYETEDENIRKALDFWLFSYLSNGINIKDVCMLKPTNFEQDFFYYFRSKTKNTKKKDLRPIKVPLTERSKAIIERWRNKDSRNPYLFPVLEEGLNASQIFYKVQDFIFFIIRRMKTVAKDLKMDVKLGTYVARHSHSTMLKRKGVPTELIKENLGHSSILVTENYLADFTDEVKQEYAKLLTDL